MFELFKNVGETVTVNHGMDSKITGILLVDWDIIETCPCFFLSCFQGGGHEPIRVNVAWTSPEGGHQCYVWNEEDGELVFSPADGW